jgi:peptidoglycan/xylan/chitin deacetylase (PgdA/CDA1 family)
MLIVTYHAVEGPPSPVCCPPAALEAHLAGLRDAGFAFVSLDHCAAWLRGEQSLAPRSIVVTFDDAYQSVVTTALPILQRYGVPAVMYVIGERIGGDNQWPGQWGSIPRLPLAGASELREWIGAGMTIGSHSWTHPRLNEIDASRLREELDESADRLEQIFGTSISHFAFPYGARGTREIEAVRRRYATAVNAQPGTVDKGDSPHDLCRLDCHDLGVAIRLNCLEAPWIEPYLSTRRAMRGIRRGVDRALGRV